MAEAARRTIRATRAVPGWVFTLFFGATLLIALATVGVEGAVGLILVVILLGVLALYTVAGPVDAWTLWVILSGAGLAAVVLEAPENGLAAFLIVMAATGAAYLLLGDGRDPQSGVVLERAGIDGTGSNSGELSDILDDLDLD